jgi:hypothetical protein
MLTTRLIGQGRHKIQIKEFFTDLVLGGSENLCDCLSQNYFTVLQIQTERLKHAYMYTVSRGIGFFSNSLSLFQSLWRQTMLRARDRATSSPKLIQKFSKTTHASFRAYNPGHSRDAIHKSKYTDISAIAFIWSGKLNQIKCSQPDLSGTADIRFKLKNSLLTSYSADRKICVIV